MMKSFFRIFTILTFAAAFLVLLVFFRGTYNEYVGDDAEYYRDIYDRPTMADMWSFSKQTTHQGKTNYYSPMLIVIFTTIFKLFDGNIHAFHIFDAVVHFLNGLLIYLLFFDKVKYRILLLFFCMIFIFHPLQIGTMQFISAFAHLLSLQVFLWTLLAYKAYLTTNKIQFYWLSIALSLLDYLTYLTTYPLFFILTLSFFVFLPQTKISWTSVKNAAKLAVPHGLFLMPFIAVTLWKYPQSQIVKAWGGSTLSAHTLLRELDILSWFFVPGFVSIEMREALILAILIGFVALLVWGIQKESREVVFGLLWTVGFLTLMSMSNFRPTVTVARYFYIPCVGLGFALIIWVEFYIKKYLDFPQRKTA